MCTVRSQVTDQFAVCSLLCGVYGVPYLVSSVQYSQCTVHSQCISYNVQNMLCNVQDEIYSVQCGCLMSIMKCTVDSDADYSHTASTKLKPEMKDTWNS